MSLLLTPLASWHLRLEASSRSFDLYAGPVTFEGDCWNAASSTALATDAACEKGSADSHQVGC